MCLACEEMDLYYAYLDAVEEAKRKAQPWECEVTIIAQDDAAPANSPAARGFACDDVTDAPVPAAGKLSPAKS